MIEPGTPIAVVAPSHAYNVERFQAGLAIARAHGHDLRPLPGNLAPHRYFAGTDAHRAAQLVRALTSDEYGAVWMVRGGSGMTRLLRYLPWNDLPARPVIGFSDTTALLLPLAARGGVGIHGPVLHSLGSTDAESVAHLFDLLAGKPTAPLQGRVLRHGAASGPLIGGNLCLMGAMCGSPWQPDARGAILVLEEIGEHPYRVDRCLEQLRASGVLDGITGVALGEFVNCSPPPGAAWTLDEVFEEFFGDLGIPVLADLPIGHGAANRAFPVGATARIESGMLSWEPPR